MKKYILYSIFSIILLNVFQTTMPMGRFKTITTRICNAIVNRPSTAVVLGTCSVFFSSLCEHFSPKKPQQNRTNVIIEHMATIEHRQKDDNTSDTEVNQFFDAHIPNTEENIPNTNRIRIFSALQHSPITQDFKAPKWLQKFFGKKHETIDDAYTQCYKESPYKGVRCTTTMPTSEFYARLNEHMQKLEKRRTDESQKKKKEKKPLTPFEQEMMILRSLSL